jgi:adenosylmethionine-8-amino-7-oxononanoate aminotransferase
MKSNRAVPRDWDKSFPIIDRAEGIYLYDESGKRYIDGSGGSSVCTSIGHGVKEIPRAVHEQASKISYAPTHAFTCAPVVELANRIVSAAPGELRNNSRVWFSCTGTDATDDAVRLARQYWVEKGKPSKYQVICRWQAFHGNNIAVAGFSGITSRRRFFQPMFVDSPHIPPAYCYRCPFEKSHPGCGLLCARALETAIRQQGPENVSAFIVEPVVGAALAAVPAPEGYFQEIRRICDAYDVLLIDDEVMTGWGRTGMPWGIDHWGVTPDIIATAKGITAGYIPLAATIARESIWSVLEENHSSFRAGHTLNANAVACAASIAVLDYMEKHRLTENAARRGEQALAGLQAMMERHPTVGRVSGLGLMLGVEFVRDKSGKDPFPPGEKLSARVEQAALGRGLIVFPCYGCVDGVEGNMVMIAPPLTISERQVEELLQLLDESITEVEQNLGIVPMPVLQGRVP